MPDSLCNYVECELLLRPWTKTRSATVVSELRGSKSFTKPDLDSCAAVRSEPNAVIEADAAEPVLGAVSSMPKGEPLQGDQNWR